MYSGVITWIDKKYIQFFSFFFHILHQPPLIFLQFFSFSTFRFYISNNGIQDFPVFVTWLQQHIYRSADELR